MRTVVLSHWHGDHVYGAGAFDAHVVATRRTSELMRERTEARLAEMKATPLEEFEGTPFAEIARTELEPPSSTIPSRSSTTTATSAAPRGARRH